MIESASAGLRYYGSTCSELHKRLWQHNSLKRQYESGTRTRGCTSFQILNNPDCRILLIEPFPCNNIDELTAREAHYIRTNECVNKQMKTETIIQYNKQYYEQHKEQIKARVKEYAENNKEKVAEYKKKYANENREELRQKRQQWKAEHQKAISEAGRAYYERNKERIKAQAKAYKAKKKADNQPQQEIQEQPK